MGWQADHGSLPGGAPGKGSGLPGLLAGFGHGGAWAEAAPSAALAGALEAAAGPGDLYEGLDADALVGVVRRLAATARRARAVFPAEAKAPAAGADPVAARARTGACSLAVTAPKTRVAVVAVAAIPAAVTGLFAMSGRMVGHGLAIALTARRTRRARLPAPLSPVETRIPAAVRDWRVAGTRAASQERAAMGGVQLGEHILQVEHRVAAARGSAVADKRDRLGPPRGEVPVDGGLEGSGVAVVVLGSHKDERVGGIQAGREVGHACRAWIRFAGHLGRLGGQGEGDLDLGNIHDIYLEGTVLAGAVSDPGSHHRPEPAISHAADQDQQPTDFAHAHDFGRGCRAQQGRHEAGPRKATLAPALPAGSNPVLTVPAADGQRWAGRLAEHWLTAAAVIVRAARTALAIASSGESWHRSVRVNNASALTTMASSCFS